MTLAPCIAIASLTQILPMHSSLHGVPKTVTVPLPTYMLQNIHTYIQLCFRRSGRQGFIVCVCVCCAHTCMHMCVVCVGSAPKQARRWRFGCQSSLINEHKALEEKMDVAVAVNPDAFLE